MAKTNKVSAKQRVKSITANGRARLKLYMSRRPHRSFRLTRHVRQQLGGSPLPSPLKLWLQTLRFIWQDKKLFFGIAAIYGLLSYFLVGGVSQIDFVAMREVTVETMSGDLNAFGTMLALFGGTLSGAVAEPPSQLQQFLGTILGFMFWLVLVWAARMRVASERITIRDALYNSGAPIIPSMLVMFVILLQLLPAILALFAYAVFQAGGWMDGGVEIAIGVIVVGLASLLSAYWVASSSMAMVIVTLPQMYPWRALSAASELVIGQRWRLALRLGIMFVIVALVWAIIMFIALILDNWLRFDWLPLVPVTVQTLMAATLMFTSVYIYKLYRSLL